MRPDARAEIARRFRRLRRRSFLTQRKLAGLIGICRQAVSEIENKRVLPHFGTWDNFGEAHAESFSGPAPLSPLSSFSFPRNS